jgi:hypothetical protein
MMVSGASDMLPAGRSIVFAEVNTGDQGAGSTPATLETAFDDAWFGGAPPAGFMFGTYSGSGVGLSGSGDGVHIFDSSQAEIAGASFGAAAPGVTFDDTSGTPTLSVRGVHGARPSLTGGELGSPGTIAPDTTAPTLMVADNTGTYAFTATVDITCNATDDRFGSGIRTGCTGIDAAASSFGVGTHTLTLSASDFAGNTATTKITFTVQPKPSPGGGGGTRGSC